MRDQPVIIRDNQTLATHYSTLKRKDIICSRIRMSWAEESILTDLVERGIHLIPSATSQLASRSKVFQAKIFNDFMLPDTLAIYNSHQLLEACSLYNKTMRTEVVLKNDRKNAGLGIHLFRNIEDLYNQVSLSSIQFPFVISPFINTFQDIRVIILDDHIEAYERTNPNNFRKNLHCGGKSTPYRLSDEHLKFCFTLMKRGKFDYSHIDLMITEADHCFLTEINLRGGLKGAQISGERYKEKLDNLHEKLLSALLEK